MFNAFFKFLTITHNLQITNVNVAVLYYKLNFVNYLESEIFVVELFNKHFCNSDTALHAVKK